MIIYVYHAYVTTKGANTQAKGFHAAKESNLIDERVEFTDKPKQKKIVNATYVFDMFNNKVLKNRYRNDPNNPVSDEALINYIVNEYEEEIVEHLKLMKAKMMQDE